VNRVAVAAALLALAAPLPAAAHEPGAPTLSGYVATVSAIEPAVLGLRARAVAGDQVVLSNLSRGPVVILDPAGEPFIRIASGSSRAWHDTRVVERGSPPPPAPGAPATDPRFVKNWTIPGRAGTRRFAIRGFLGWVPPNVSEDDGVSPVLLAAAAAALVALSAAGAYLLGRRAR
jgi:hypothetical protein